MKIGASYSTICADELLLKLVPQYLVEKPETCRFWQRGVNDTYQICCADELYSLRIYRHGLRSKVEIDFEIAALNYLHEHGAKVAYPIAKREGGFVSELHSPEGLRYAIMTTHAKGSIPNYDDAENARLFGASVAELHHRSEGFETEHVRPRLETGYLLDSSLDIIRPFLQKNPADLKFVEDTAADLRRAVSNVPASSLDVGFCHGDCHGCNVHNDQGLLTHFDFDCCGFGFRVFELATFRWGSWNDDNSSALWSLFLEGYRSKRDIGAEDLALVDSFVIIRHIWWMALIMGNARDFGYSETGDGFINHHLGYIRKLLRRVKIQWQK